MTTSKQIIDNAFARMSSQEVWKQWEKQWREQADQLVWQTLQNRPVLNYVRQRNWPPSGNPFYEIDPAQKGSDKTGITIAHLTKEALRGFDHSTIKIQTISAREVDAIRGLVPLKPYVSAVEQRRRDVAELVREDHESKRDTALVRAIGRAFGA